VIGGSPVPQPGYFSGGFPIQQMPVQASPARNPAPRAVPTSNRDLVQSNGTRAVQPKVRAQMEDPPARPLRLQMPSPAELGLGARTEGTEVDWSTVRQRLRRLDVTTFALQKLPDSKFNFRCIVPTVQGPRRLEAEAAGEAEAIDRVLTQAENLR
jgi:hypothetical protein